MKKDMLLWSVSLIIIGIVTFILAGSKIVGISLPDIIVRILGIIDIIALPVFGYSTWRKYASGKWNFIMRQMDS